MLEGNEPPRSGVRALRESRWCFWRRCSGWVVLCCPSAPAPWSAEAHPLRGWRDL